MGCKLLMSAGNITKKFQIFLERPLAMFFFDWYFWAMMNFVTTATLNRRWWRGL